MKKIISILTIALVLVGVSFISSCNEYDWEIDDSLRTPAVNTMYAEGTTALGTTTVGVEVGTLVEVTGNSLDRVTLITVGANEAAFETEGFLNLTFNIPYGNYDYSFDSDTYLSGVRYQDTVRVYGITGEDMIYQKVIYLNVPFSTPVGSVDLETATVGDVVTISGYCLDQVTSVKMGSTSVDFTLSDDNSAITFSVPAGSYEPGDNTYSLLLVYDGGYYEAALEFTVQIPEGLVEGTSATGAINSDNTIVGTGLNLITRVSFAGVDCTIVSDGAADTLIYRVPNETFNITPDADNIITTDVIGYYGTPEQEVVLVSGFVFDATAPEYDTPVISSIAATDDVAGDGSSTAPYGAYLGGSVTMTGTYLLGVTALTVDGVDAEIVAQTESTLEFIVPSGISIDEVSLYDISVTGPFNEDGVYTKVTSMYIYPFFHWTNMTIHGKAYKNGEGCFLVPDLGRVVSTDEWVNERIDGFAIDYSGNGWTGAAVKSASVLDYTIVTSEEDYLSCLPYIFLNINSSVNVRFQNPAGSNSCLNNFYTSAGDKIITSGSGPGTPIIMFKDLTDNTYETYVNEKTLTSQNTYTYVSSSSTRDYYSHWTVGSVMAVQHFSYAAGDGTRTIDRVSKTGFMKIVAVDGFGDAANTGSTSSTVTVDIFWPANYRFAD